MLINGSKFGARILESSKCFKTNFLTPIFFSICSSHTTFYQANRSAIYDKGFIIIKNLIFSYYHFILSYSRIFFSLHISAKAYCFARLSLSRLNIAPRGPHSVVIVVNDVLYTQSYFYYPPSKDSKKINLSHSTLHFSRRQVRY